MTSMLFIVLILLSGSVYYLDTYKPYQNQADILSGRQNSALIVLDSDESFVPEALAGMDVKYFSDIEHGDLKGRDVIRIAERPITSPFYITPLGLITLYAVFLGTNSFSIPMAEPMALTLAVLGRGGPYEMTAYILVAVATYNQSRFALTNNSYRISPVPRMSLEQWVGIGLAITLILLAGWHEAAMIAAL
ncbi:hypothetical protein C5S42_09710 [Candidatus Methanomarinus sp.]|nr:hypothetical protein C5S42_09710 [ANME-2 cluster archaeon]